jgi:Tol biopolymer transport system component
MVTGQRAFPGDSQASLIASILKSEPAPVSSLRPECPPAIDRLVTACLAKDPEQRWQSARDLATELRWIAERGGGERGGPTAGHAVRRRSERLAWVSAVVLLAVALALALLRREAPAPAAVVRFALPFPQGSTPAPIGQPAISSRGNAVAVMGVLEGRFHVFVHSLDSPTTILVPDSEDAGQPFWSPDGRELAFGVTTELRKFDVARGSVQRLATLPANLSGGAWSPSGGILASAGGTLMTVPAAGGEARALELGEPKARFQPHFLPDGRHYLFTTVRGTADTAVYAASLEGGDAKLLVENAYAPGYAAASGQLLFVRANVLITQPFDPRRLELSGNAAPASDQVALVPRGGPVGAYGVSANDTLVWQSSGLEDLQLTWFDRSGRRLDPVGEPGDYSAPALSPDERSLAVAKRDTRTRTRDIWIFDLLRNTSRRLTFDDTDEVGPAWSPDGIFVAYSSTKNGARDIRRRRADGSGEEEVLVPNDNVVGGFFMEAWSPDGTLILHNAWRNGLQPDLFLVRVPPAPGDASIPFADSGFAEHYGNFSPDGRWIAYSTNETGRNEVYVSPVPREGATAARKTLISTSGGIEPRWRKDGKELFYVQGSSVMAVEMAVRGSEIEPGRPRRLFDVTLPEPRRNRLVVTHDGQRFLVNLSLSPLNAPLEVMLNWRPKP